MSEVFTGQPGRFVKLEESIAGFKALLEGAGDEYPEASFYMMGGLQEAFERGRQLATETAK